MVGRGRKRAILVPGDGSVQFNIQELLTVRHLGLPLKLFVFNNAGYSCIRSTQNSLFESRIVAADSKSGVGQMDFRKLAELYGFQYGHIGNNDEIVEGVQAMRFATMMQKARGQRKRDQRAACQNTSQRGRRADAEFHDLWAKSRATFQSACTLMDCYAESILIPFEGKGMPGYFFRSKGAPGKRPTLMIHGGADTSGEELYFWCGAAAVRRGSG